MQSMTVEQGVDIVDAAETSYSVEELIEVGESEKEVYKVSSNGETFFGIFPYITKNGGLKLNNVLSGDAINNPYNRDNREEPVEVYIWNKKVWISYRTASSIEKMSYFEAKRRSKNDC